MINLAYTQSSACILDDIYCFSLTAIIVVPATDPPLELMSTSNGNPVYREQEVTFTCTTRGSPTLAWSSDHYIGVGSLLEFVPWHLTPKEQVKHQLSTKIQLQL